MRFVYKGKVYKLKHDALQLIQGTILLILGCLCHKVDADGAALFLWMLSISYILPIAEKYIIYRIAKAYVSLMDRKENLK